MSDTRTSILVAKLATRLAAYCDALGYDDKDVEILNEANDLLGEPHVDLALTTDILAGMPES